MLNAREEGVDLAGLVHEEAELEVLATGFGFIEGPVWSPRDRCLLFSDIPGDTRYRWSCRARRATSTCEGTNKANGLALDAEDRLLSCEHATSMLVRYEDGQRSVLASHHDGLELNSPNDVVVHSSRRRVLHRSAVRARRYTARRSHGAQELDFQGVFRLDPDGGSFALLADDFAKPNGLCFDDDERVLYVNDTERMHIRRFAVSADGGLSRRRRVLRAGRRSAAGTPGRDEARRAREHLGLRAGRHLGRQPARREARRDRRARGRRQSRLGRGRHAVALRHREHGPVPDPNARRRCAPSIPQAAGMTDLTGEIAVVVGASQGIGEAIAQTLAAAGARVVVTSRDGATAERVAASLGEGHVGLALDVRSTESVDAAAASVVASLGTPSILVNNAGINHIGPAESFTDERVGRGHRRQPHGRLPLLPRVRRAHARSGSGLDRQHLVVERDDGPARPRTVRSEQSRHRRADAHAGRRMGRSRCPRQRRPSRPRADSDGRRRDRARRARRARDHRADAGGRLGAPADVGGAVLLLCLPAAGFITAQTLVVDGGYTMYASAHGASEIVSRVEGASRKDE